MYPGALVIENPNISDVDNTGFTLNNYKGESKPIRVRFQGVDIPEYNPKYDKVEPCGKKAFDTIDMLLQWSETRLKLYEDKEIGTDNIAAYVVVQEHSAYKEVDAHFVQGELIRMGYAKLNKTDLPESKLTQELLQLEKEAKVDKRGIWNTNMCNAEEDSTE